MGLILGLHIGMGLAVKHQRNDKWKDQILPGIRVCPEVAPKGFAA
jgi:hypothetical protein